MRFHFTSAVLMTAAAALFVGSASAQLSPQEPADGSAQQSADQFAKKNTSFAITQMTDGQYPDNPDIGFAASTYDHGYFSGGAVELTTATTGTFTFNSAKGLVKIGDIDLMEFMPSAPKHLRNDDYMTLIALVNQEWNRNQVRFDRGEFETENATISRVDLARNCLNSYLWEVILYTKEGEQELPMAHGWFKFPKEYYAELFERRNNGLKFADYKSSLEFWEDPVSKVVNVDLLRSDVRPIKVASFKDRSQEMYPLKKARLKKKKDIIFPASANSMEEFHTDESLFATFANPGIYTRATPRVTELGRFQQLTDFSASSVKTSDGKRSTELVLSFGDDKGRTTKFYLGGLDVQSFPALAPSEANSGYKISMGFSNHTFYESYKEHLAWDSSKHPYYGFIVDEDGKWLDSHKIGVDGPILHWDKSDSNTLHFWLLSFERHAIIGHYTITLAAEELAGKSKQIR